MLLYSATTSSCPYLPKNIHTYLVGQGVLLEVMGLHKLHTTLTTDERPYVLVLHHVVLQLTWVLEALATLAAVVLCWPTVDCQMSFQLCKCWKVKAALHTHIFLAPLMLKLMGLKLTRVGEASSTHTATVWLDITVLHHVSLQVTCLSECLVAHLALMGTGTLVGEHVCVQVAQLLEKLPTEATAMWLDATMAQDVRDKVVLRSVGLLTHAALPALLFTSYIHIVAVIYVDVQAKLFSTAQPSSGAVCASSVVSWHFALVEGIGRKVHDWAWHEEWERDQTWTEGWEVWRRRVQEKMG